MARYSVAMESQSAQLGGVPSGLTVNGYIGYWGASATAGYRLRRVFFGVRTATAVPPTSQQVQVGLYRQTVAPAGTGLAAAVLGIPQEIWTPQTDPTVGVIAATATAIGTTGPTIGANPMHKWDFNTASAWDVPTELPEEIVCNLGTANGLAFVNLGPTLPTGHILTVSLEIEV